MNKGKSNQKTISAVFEFSRDGRLKGIFLNADSDRDQATIERYLERLIRPTSSGRK